MKYEVQIAKSEARDTRLRTPVKFGFRRSGFGLLPPIIF